jgi:AAA family ATP:ADP antiporter
LGSIKDALIITEIGFTAIPFLKTYVTFPISVLMLLIYIKLWGFLSYRNVFYAVTSFFLAYFIIFTSLLYLGTELVHPDKQLISELVEKYPSFKWPLLVVGKWSFSSFYVISELWGNVMISWLFWQFANQITRVNEAKRFYPILGVVTSVFTALFPSYIIRYFYLDNHMISSFISYFTGTSHYIATNDQKLIPMCVVIIMICIIILFLYKWINKNVLIDPVLCDPDRIHTQKNKIEESILTSKYLWLIILLISTCGMAVALIEGIWKSKVQMLYPTFESYTGFMSTFLFYKGISAILLAIIGINISQKVSWLTAAMITPFTTLVVGLTFATAMFLCDILSSEILVIVVVIGAIQHTLVANAKIYLFNVTKHMAYIQLPDAQFRAKGQAFVEVMGALGTSLGGVIQTSFFIFFPNSTFADAVPYFMSIFFITVLLWIYTVKALGKKYNTLTQ